MENNSEEEISLKELILKFLDWFQYLKSKWIIIFIMSLFGGVLGLSYSYIKKPVYTATLTFALEEKSAGGASGINSIASSFGLNLGSGEGGAFAGENIIELMKSRLMIEKTLLSNVIIEGKKEILINYYINLNSPNINKENSSNLPKNKFDSNDRAFFTRAQDSILGIIQSSIIKSNLDVSKIDKKLSIISVKVSSINEAFAKLFCENLVKNVTDFYVETKVGKSKKNVQILESRIDSVKRELDQAMYGRAILSDQNMGLIRQSAAVPKLKQEMRVQMLGTMYGELVKNLEFSKLALMREEPLIQIIDTPIYPLSKEKISILNTTLISMFVVSLLTIIYLIICRLFNILIDINN